MALKAILTNDEHSALAEPLKTEYKKSGDAFTLDVVSVNGMTLENVTGLKSALGSEREIRGGLEKFLRAWGYKETKNDEGKVTGWEPGDLKPDVVKTALAKLAKLEKIDVNTEAGKLAKEQVESIKEQLMTAHKQEIDTRDTKITGLNAALDTALVDNAITEALTDSEVKGNPALLTPIMRKGVKRVERDGAQVVVVVDDKGVPRVNGQAQNMTPKELALELKGVKEYQGAFEGSGHAGSDGVKSGDQRKQITLDDKSRPVDRITKGLQDPATVRGAAGPEASQL